MSTDNYPAASNRTVSAPLRSIRPATLSDTVDLAVLPTRVLLKEGGTLKFRMVGDTDPITWTFDSATELDWRIERIYATGTTIPAASIYLGFV